MLATDRALIAPPAESPALDSEICRHAIHGEAVGICSLSGNAELARRVEIGGCDHHARCQLKQGIETPTIHRQVVHKLSIDDRADGA